MCGQVFSWEHGSFLQKLGEGCFHPFLSCKKGPLGQLADSLS